MRADSLPGNVIGAGLVEVEAASLVPIDAEFVAMMASGDVGMGAGLDVWVDAEGCAGFAF